MTTTHVIILCQGSQKRLPTLTCAKQMLPLAACGDTPILIRTLVQICALTDDARVQVVAWQPVIEQVLLAHWPGGVGPLMLDFLTLPEPGNSSLKGASEVLRRRPSDLTADRTVILLGDVVYSWDCLRRALTVDKIYFLGTGDISPSGGELFAVRWTHDAEETMLALLDRALATHPKFEEYQPGQMRRWMIGNHPWSSALPNGVRQWSSYSVIDDYTDDVDVPEDVTNLPALSALAAADDARNGAIW